MTEYVGYGELKQLWRSLGRMPENMVKIYPTDTKQKLGTQDVGAIVNCCLYILTDFLMAIVENQPEETSQFFKKSLKLEAHCTRTML